MNQLNIFLLITSLIIPHVTYPMDQKPLNDDEINFIRLEDFFDEDDHNSKAPNDSTQPTIAPKKRSLSTSKKNNPKTAPSKNKKIKTNPTVVESLKDRLYFTCEQKNCNNTFTAKIQDNNTEKALDALTRSFIKHKGTKHNSEFYNKIKNYVTQNLKKNNKTFTVKCSKKTCSKNFKAQSTSALVGSLIGHLKGGVDHRNEKTFSNEKQKIKTKNQEIIDNFTPLKPEKLEIKCSSCTEKISFEIASSNDMQRLVTKTLLHKYLNHMPRFREEIKNKIQEHIFVDKETNDYKVPCQELSNNSDEKCLRIINAPERGQLPMLYIQHIKLTKIHNKTEYEEVKKNIKEEAKKQNINLNF